MPKENREKPESVGRLLKLPKIEQFEYLKSWLECAESDIQIIEYAYNTENYPIACYHLEQAVEKITKCFAYLINVLKSDEEAMRDINHHAFYIFKLVQNKRDRILSDNDYIKYNLYSIIYNKTFNLLVEYYSKYDSIRSNQEIISDIRKVSISVSNIMQHDIYNIAKICKKSLLNSNIEYNISAMEATLMIYPQIKPASIIAKDPSLKQKLVPEAVDSILVEFKKNGFNIDDSKKDIYDKIPDFINMLDSEKLSNTVQRFMLLICIWDLILRLSVLTDSVEANSRYPSLKEKTSPFKIYTAEHQLIKNIKELNEITKYLLSAVRDYLELEFSEYSSNPLTMQTICTE